MRRKTPTPKVVGIDPSYTCTGIAYADGTTQPIRTSPDQSDRVRRKIVVAAVTTAAHDADLAVVEFYSFGSRLGRERLGGLGEAIRDALGDLAIPVVDVAPLKLKKWATGNGSATKKAVKAAAVEALGLSEKATHDEADAAWLRAAGLHLLGVGDRLPPSVCAEALAEIELPGGIRP